MKTYKNVLKGITLSLTLLFVTSCATIKNIAGNNSNNGVQVSELIFNPCKVAETNETKILCAIKQFRASIKLTTQLLEDDVISVQTAEYILNKSKKIEPYVIKLSSLTASLIILRDNIDKGEASPESANTQVLELSNQIAEYRDLVYYDMKEINEIVNELDGK